MKVDPQNRHILLTHKPSLIDSTYDIIKDYNVPEGLITTGIIVKVDSFGIIIGFYEDVSAVALKRYFL